MYQKQPHYNLDSHTIAPRVLNLFLEIEQQIDKNDKYLKYELLTSNRGKNETRGWHRQEKKGKKRKHTHTHIYIYLFLELI